MKAVINVRAESDMSGLRKHIAKVNKKATKYGCDQITMSIGEPYIKKYCFDDKKDQKILVREVTVEYFPVKIPGGWTVLGSIEKTDSGWNLINGNVDNIGDLKTYDLTWCDHCQTRRNRRKVIILADKDGVRKIVGRQCVVEYLGVSVEHAIYAAGLENILYSAMNELSLDDENGGGWGSNSPESRGYEVQLVARMTAGVMSKSHWTYKSAKYDEFDNTPNHVCSAINAYLHPGRVDKEFSAYVESLMTEETNKIADEYLTELREKYSEDKIPTLDNSFEYDMAVMLACDSVMKLNYFVGMFGYQLSKRCEKSTKRDPMKSEYYGSVGDKLKSVTLEVTKTKGVQSDWGVSLMICGYFKSTNNQFVCFYNGSDHDLVFDENNNMRDEITVNATVKSHQDRGYGKQTALVRIKKSK